MAATPQPPIKNVAQPPSAVIPDSQPRPVPNLKGREIVVGVCGGIAAYKVADVVSKLVQAGAGVTVCMTTEATRFVAPLTFERFPPGRCEPKSSISSRVPIPSTSR